ncbi:pseudouridine synthase [Solimonas sp. SE-A11]|uniref:pseudouridine synthase n=1 Tax=Solimonas sp. SE-A11 TaxID=3054954 RepID=UPI00259CA1E4|nr:pseudouridine synthase [Solimonas sp. SE-A11]
MARDASELPPQTAPTAPGAGERIQKALATAGVASRREIESMIADGRIQVNGQPASVGQQVSPQDRIMVDGRPVRLSAKAEAPQVLLFKKRTGEMVTRDDPDGRKTIFRNLPELDNGRWIAVGRLDINTSGLLLLTNHGELARRLTHPSFEVPRRYAVRVLGEMTDEKLSALRKGVKLEDGDARFDSIAPGLNEDGQRANQWYEVMLREGRNREVRRLFESQDLQVSRLIRISYGPVELGRGIRSGSYREATPDELRRLFDCVQLELPTPAKAGRSERRERADEDSEVPFRAKKLSRLDNKKKHSWAAQPSSQGPRPRGPVSKGPSSRGPADGGRKTGAVKRRAR